MSESVLSKVKTKLELNTYVMSCYLNREDLYTDMRNHLEMLVEELEKCYSEIADKEAIIAEYGKGTFTDMKGNFFICNGTVHFSGMGAVGASPIKKLV